MCCKDDSLVWLARWRPHSHASPRICYRFAWLMLISLEKEEGGGSLENINTYDLPYRLKHEPRTLPRTDLRAREQAKTTCRVQDISLAQTHLYINIIPPPFPALFTRNDQAIGVRAVGACVHPPIQHRFLSRRRRRRVSPPDAAERLAGRRRGRSRCSCCRSWWRWHAAAGGSLAWMIPGERRGRRRRRPGGGRGSRRGGRGGPGGFDAT